MSKNKNKKKEGECDQEVLGTRTAEAESIVRSERGRKSALLSLLSDIHWRNRGRSGRIFVKTLLVRDE